MLLLAVFNTPAWAYDITSTATARFLFAGTPWNITSNTVTASVTRPPTVATLELLHHAADSSATPIAINDFSATPAPGTFTPLDPQPAPGNLSSATNYDEGELIVIRVSDGDQNLHPGIIDTVTVTISVSATADTELLRIYESGPNTGVFIGYIYSGITETTTYNGYLTAPGGSTVVLSYQDNVDVRTATAPVNATLIPQLWLQLEADEELVAPGDPLGFTLTVENIDPRVTAQSVTITQNLPSGFRYRDGTTTIDTGASLDPSISADGRSLTFNIGDLIAGETREVSFIALIGAVRPGDYASEATASVMGILASNTATDTVYVRDPFGADKNYLAGRVLQVDSCSEQGSSSGLAGIRVFLEDGSYVITDELGRYHFEGINPGTHVVQLDSATYPAGLQPALCEDHTRSAGNAASRFLELQPGSLWRTDFYLSKIPINGEVSIALNNTLAIGEAATYSVSLSGRDLVVRNQTLEVELPPEAEFLPGSTTLNGSAITDPDIEGNTLSFELPEQQGHWESTLTFRTLINENTDTGEMLAGARLHFDTMSSKRLVTPTAESALIWISRGERREVQELLLQPRFDSLDAELNTRDRQILQETINRLKLLDLIKIYVIGHTDARRIRWNEGVAYRDNFELSEARADAVARELLNQLELAPEQVITVGLGAADPISLESSAEGLAQNRRTDLRVLHRIVIHPERDQVKAEGGEIRSIRAEQPPTISQKQPVELPLGILSFRDQDTLADPVQAVRIRLDQRLKPSLTLDGTEISPDRIGYQLREPENKTTLMTYIGVNFGEPGQHQLKIQGRDPFGNIRYEQQLTLTRTGKIAAIRVVDTEGNIADGRSPLRVRLELLDAQNEIIHAQSKLEIRGGDLIPSEVRKQRLPRSSEERLAEVNAEGWTSFEPVDRSGLYRVTLGHADAEVEVEIFVSPEQREWILVGIANGTAGTRQILEGAEQLPEGSEDGYYDEGRLAFFARGQVKGDWLLTAAYDSDKEDRRNLSLHQIIDPDSYYTLYGDTTTQGYAAPSAERLYARIEKQRFYAMFGDLDSGLNTTELSRYSRSLTGFKSEYLGRHLGYNLFISETEQSYVRDEIPGDGTSGLYQLSRVPLVINSEKISIETRDRYHSETLLKSRSLQRHLDYDIDFTTGTLYFKEPIPSRDAKFNPITIVVEYETHERSSNDLTYGGRGYIKAFNQALEVGATSVHQGANTLETDLYGLDTQLKLGEFLTLKSEWATTRTDTVSTSLDGDAWLSEVRYTTPQTDARLYAREQQGDFGLGQQAASERDTRKLGGEFSQRLAQPLTLSAELFSQEYLKDGTHRKVAEGRMDYAQENYGLNIGLRHARDGNSDGRNDTSNQLLTGGDWKVNESVTLSARHEQSLGDNANRDYPTRTLLGVDYDLTQSVALFAQQEYTQGEHADTEGTRIGLRAKPWDGAQVRTSVEQTLGENGERSYANLGLSQGWQVTAKLGLDVSLDRSQSLSGHVNHSIHPDQPPAAGSSEEFTAVSSGLSYRESHWTIEGRAELRTADREDRWGVFVGSIVEPQKDVGLSFSGRFAHSDKQHGSWDRDTELRFGLALRPAHRTWLILDRLDLIRNETGRDTSDEEGVRIVNRLNSHWRATQKLQVALNTGVRYVAEQFAGQELDALTTLLGSEIRYDFTPRWDLGLHLSSLNAWEAAQADYRSGLSVGYSPAKNLWLSIGYNFTGFQDRDFSAADYTAEGAFLRFRVKFDQQSVREAVELLTR